MKTSAALALHFTGYPLKVIDAFASTGEKKYLRVVTDEDSCRLRFSYQVNDQVNDPVNWDDAWFSNYE